MQVAVREPEWSQGRVCLLVRGSPQASLWPSQAVSTGGGCPGGDLAQKRGFCWGSSLHGLPCPIGWNIL